MTYEESLEIAIEEITQKVIYLKSSYEKSSSEFKKDCYRLINAQNVLIQALDNLKETEDASNL